MKLNELSLLKRKQENKYYLILNGKKRGQKKEYNFITSESLTHYFQITDQHSYSQEENTHY